MQKFLPVEVNFLIQFPPIIPRVLQKTFFFLISSRPTKNITLIKPFKVEL